MPIVKEGSDNGSEWLELPFVGLGSQLALYILVHGNVSTCKMSCQATCSRNYKHVEVFLITHLTK